MMPFRDSPVKSVSAVRKKTRGEIPSGLPPELRGTGARGSMAWAHHHPKTEVIAQKVRVDTGAIGTAHAPEGMAERAAPQHTIHISSTRASSLAVSPFR